MRKVIPTILAFALAAGAGFAPNGAGAASRCDSRLVVFSRDSNNPLAVNWNGVACFFADDVPDSRSAADGPADFRLINPNSDSLSVRFIDEVRFSPTLIPARLNGLGFKNKRIFLTYQDISLQQDGSVFGYERDDIALDPSRGGCLTVKAWYTHTKKTKNGVKKIKVFSETTKYHTFDALC